MLTPPTFGSANRNQSTSFHRDSDSPDTPRPRQRNGPNARQPSDFRSNSQTRAFRNCAIQPSDSGFRGLNRNMVRFNDATKCYSCGAEGHWKKRCPQIKCNFCGKMGHMRANCFAARKTSNTKTEM